MTLPPVAHANDPSTSHEAAEKVTRSGKRQTHMRQVLAAVVEQPYLTAADYGRITGLGRVEAARRLSDLKNMGEVARSLAVWCEGTRQSTWLSLLGGRL